MLRSTGSKDTRASVFVARGLQSESSVFVAHVLSWLHGMWDLPGQWMELMFPALAGGFFTAGPPGQTGQLFISEHHLLFHVVW